MYTIKSPALLQILYPSLIWHKSRNEKVVYLTFDDGPIPDVTEFVLNTLKSYAAKATFFCIGDNIVKHTDIFNRVVSEGHKIGNHTFNHLKGWITDDDIYLNNVLKCQQLTGTNLFRPPYGRIKRSQIKSLHSLVPDPEPLHPDPQETEHLLHVSDVKGADPDEKYQIIMWDVLSADFDTNISPEKCYQNVVQNAKNGSIIVFHDSLKAYDRLRYALPKALKYFKEKNYQFGVL